MAKSNVASSHGGSSDQPIEELQRRYRDLNEQKIRSETQRDEAAKQLDKLKAEARAKYGTDDLVELRGKLNEMVAENARKVAEYKKHLDMIDQGLAEVERKFGASASSPSDTEQPHR